MQVLNLANLLQNKCYSGHNMLRRFRHFFNLILIYNEHAISKPFPTPKCCNITQLNNKMCNTKFYIIKKNITQSNNK